MDADRWFTRGWTLQEAAGPAEDQVLQQELDAAVQRAERQALQRHNEHHRARDDDQRRVHLVLRTTLRPGG